MEHKRALPSQKAMSFTGLKVQGLGFWGSGFSVLRVLLQLLG